MMTLRQAQCSCGQLTVTTQGDPIRVSVCHCYACQRRSGSVFGVQARFHESDTGITGCHKRYTRTSDDGNRVDSFFCPECGSTMFLRLEHAPDTIVVPVGAFADSDFPEPSVSIYEEQQHSWFRLGDEIEHVG